MAVNVKMGVDIGGFTAGIKQGQQILKGLNAEMKASEAEFKATGNAEQKLSSQTKTLNSQLNVQKGIADSARQALKSMTDAGVNPADAAYQKLYVTMLNAEAGANEAQAALNALAGGTEQAAQGADQLTNSLSGISKKMSLAQVADGIDKITGGLERAAQKAIQFGEQLWNVIMDSARRADDTQTMAEMYGIDLQKFKQMQALVQNGLDTSVDSMLGAQDKLKKGIGKGSEEVMTALEEMGLAFSSGKDGAAQLITDDTVELFWKAGQALMQMDDAFDKEATAQTLFGKSWKELIPLFSTYKTIEEYEDALSKTSVSSEEATKNAAELNDRVSQLEGTWTQLKDEVVGAVAGPLAKAAETLEGLLARVLEYLQTEEGQQALKDLETAVTGLFADLEKIDPEDVVEGFTSVFNTVVGSIQWLVENWDGAVAAMKGIVAGWAALKITGGVLKIVEIVNGLSTLSAAKASAAGSAAGASWGSAFASAAMKAAPFLAFLYTLLNPASSAGEQEDVLIDKNGQLTQAGIDAGWTPEMAEEQTKRKQAIIDQKERIRELTGLSEKQIKLINEMGSIYYQITDENGRFTGNASESLMKRYQIVGQQLGEAFTGQEKQLQAYMDRIRSWKKNGGSVLDFDTKNSDFYNIDKNGVEIPAELFLPEDMAAKLAAQVGIVEITGVIHWTDEGDTTSGANSRRIMNRPNAVKGHANGLPYVPYDGYLASLHKGERVVPAREVSSRNYSSNLYVESMYMNGGTDAAGLAAAMAAAQRRTMSGYGS